MYSITDENGNRQELILHAATMEILLEELTYGRIDRVQAFEVLNKHTLDWIWFDTKNNEWCITYAFDCGKRPPKSGKHKPFFMNYIPWKSFGQLPNSQHYYFGLPHMQDDPQIERLLRCLPKDLFHIIQLYYRSFYVVFNTHRSRTLVLCPN